MTAAAPSAPHQRLHTVVLTDHAPGVFGLALNDPARLRTIWAQPLAVTLRATLRRLAADPATVTVAAWGDDPALFGPVPGEAAAQPLAVLWAGATVADLAAALDVLRAAGWSPPATTPAPAPSPFEGSRP